MIMGIFDLVMQHMEELDYSTMEYLGSIDNPDEIFHAEILLSGLGAIMDVAVAISVALSEIVEQKPEVKFVELFRSGREIGYDIMGTMINVLLFVFGCGLIPTCLIRMNNEVRFVTIVKLHIPCELCRFFVESIGIVLAIPVSIFITAVMMKLSVKKREKDVDHIGTDSNDSNSACWRGQRRHVSDRSGGKYFVPESCNLALCRRSTRVFGYCRCRNFNFLYHFVLSKWDEY